MINTVFNWLRGIPGLENLRLEQLDATAGSAGLFCQGEKTLGRSRNILGNVAIRRSLAFTLCLHSVRRQTPEFFRELDRLAQSAAPILGEDQTVAVTQGRMTRSDGSGLGRFEATITFTFTSEG